jgi:hypothetical protein
MSNGQRGRASAAAGSEGGGQTIPATWQGHLTANSECGRLRWIEALKSLTVPPDLTRMAKMDVLSDVLRIVRLSGAVFFMADCSSPWALESSTSESLCVHRDARSGMRRPVSHSRGWRVRGRVSGASRDDNGGGRCRCLPARRPAPCGVTVLRRQRLSIPCFRRARTIDSPGCRSVGEGERRALFVAT